MLKKQVWLVFKILELLFTLACCWPLVWRCCQDHQHSNILVLCGFYNVLSLICLTSVIASFLLGEPQMKHEAVYASILGILHLTGIYIHFYTVNLEMCSSSVLVALCATALFVLHCKLALNQMILNGNYPDDPLIMPAFYFKRSGGSQVYQCEPKPSLNGPTGLPPVYYEEI